MTEKLFIPTPTFNLLERASFIKTREALITASTRNQIKYFSNAIDLLNKLYQDDFTREFPRFLALFYSIKNPPEQLQLFLVKKFEGILQYILNPT